MGLSKDQKEISIEVSSPVHIEHHLQIEKESIELEQKEKLTNLRILSITSILFSLFVVAEIIGAIVRKFTFSFFLSFDLFNYLFIYFLLGKSFTFITWRCCCYVC